MRKNPIHRDEEFTCIHCRRTATRGGAQVRDHCPHCLHGRHVDNVPGDRASTCGGLLKPIDFQVEGRAGVVISYRCESCGHRFRVRAHPDDVLPKGLRLDE
ncbi:MAG: RNHCP domain-containing protein [Myxococcota bacterium]|nr:RNHCP domain-containing protein [Myxococcota bacterium]